MSKKFKPSSTGCKFKPSPKATKDRPKELIQWLKKQRDSNEWKKLRKLVKVIHPMCCGDKCTNIGQAIHHVFAAAKYPDRFYELNNLVNLCCNCHGKVSQMERDNHYVEAQALYEDIAIMIANDYYKTIT